MEGVQYKIIFLLILSSFLNLSFVSGEELLFNSAGTKYINITVNYNHINGFSFNITGSEYDMSLPSDVIVDIGNDGITEWGYNVYPSETIAQDSDAIFAWSNNPVSGTTLYIQSGIDLDPEGNEDGLGSYNGETLGTLDGDNIFLRNDIIQNGNLGIITDASSLENMVSITTNTTTIHAFLPELNPIGLALLYIAEGGSTYYCNSDHEFFLTSYCDLSPAQALTSEHIAVNATQFGFNFTEPVKSPRLKDSINKALEGCSLPCNITIKITSSSAGNITLDGFEIIGSEFPAEIDMTEIAGDYEIAITNYTALSEVRYGYMEMPNIYIVPFIAADDYTPLDVSQVERLSNLSTSLKDAWDNLTNNSHPMNFTFYMNPVIIPNYTLNDNFSVFIIEAEKTFLSNITSPGILVVLDIKDYHPDIPSYNSPTTLDSRGLISIIYMNGFSNSNEITELDMYNEEIMINVLLHELAHTFIFYPTSATLFYSGHPASFTDLSEFSTYATDESPTGDEGYYEIYSILNQIRPYLVQSEIGKAPDFSILDKMLLGTLSPYSDGNYSFYSGTITKVGNKYISSEMENVNAEDINAGYLYQLSTDNYWWDVRTDSTLTSVGTDTLFDVSTAGQNSRALMVFADDIGHIGHFKVFNENAASVQRNIGNLTSFLITNLLSPADGVDYTTKTTKNITFSCTFSHSCVNLTLFTNITGSWLAHWNTAESNIDLIIENINISNGTYIWNCRADYLSNTYWADNNFTFNVVYDPTIELYCGDANCNNGETCNSCSEDCGVCNNDGSGGGGSGGGSSGNIPALTPSPKLGGKVLAGLNSIPITAADYAINKVIFSIGSVGNNGYLTVNKLPGKPHVITYLDKIVYQFFEFKTVGFDMSDSSNGALIRFDVPTIWFANNNLNVNDISLYRYVIDHWVELPTKIINQSFSSISYEAESPGFSYFAVAGKIISQTSEDNDNKIGNDTMPAVNSSLNISSVTNQNNNLTDFQESEDKSMQKPKFQLITIIWWIYGIIIVLLLLAIFVSIYRRMNSHNP
jgi:PGF-pre-PGF domain-containing protein